MLPNIELLWAQTLGNPEIRIGLLDGPVDTHHESLRGARLLTFPTHVSSAAGDGIASQHGTGIASILFGQHSGGPVRGIAPRCSGLLFPVFSDESGPSGIGCTQIDLARAIIQATEAKAHVINISAGQYSPSGQPHPILRDAVEFAGSQGVLIVAAAGNDGCECLHVPSALKTVLAVGALDRESRPLSMTNWGADYSTNGLMALGEELDAARPDGGYTKFTGTSAATAVVTGVAALLLCIALEAKAHPDPRAIRQLLLGSATVCEPAGSSECKRMMVGQLNVPAALRQLGSGDEMSATEQLTMTPDAENEPSGMTPESVQTSQVHPSGCGCAACNAPPLMPQPQFVYALGTLGFDFGSEARRDSILQHAGPASAADVMELLKYLDRNPWEAQSLLWTLNLDSTPIYVIQPEGAFAATAYDRMRQFLREHVADQVERVSVPGVVMGRARLLTGQVVPTIVPDLRGMNNWNTAALVGAVSAAASGPAKEGADGVASFLNRIYYGLRNLGLAPQERALNFAATNALNAAKVFETALRDEMRLDAVEVERSPVCRPESDCWDVKMLFFDPEHQLQRARVVYRFTVDVSDVNPVMVGPVRSWPIR